MGCGVTFLCICEVGGGDDDDDDQFMRSRNLYMPTFCPELENLQKLVMLSHICCGTTYKVL